MEAIKKKMQAMKLEKDNAVDRAEIAEQGARDANLRAEKSEEEVRGLQKKIQQIENELDQVQEQLSQANVKLEEKEKTLQNVSFDPILCLGEAMITSGRLDRATGSTINFPDIDISITNNLLRIFHATLFISLGRGRGCRFQQTYPTVGGGPRAIGGAPQGCYPEARGGFASCGRE